MSTFRTILHATDFSQRSGSAFRLACELASDNHAHLVLVHVMRRPPLLRPSEEQQQEVLARLWDLDVPEELAPIRRLEEGNPALEIVRLAQMVKADLIVLGVHARSGLSQYLIPSVAEKVMRLAECPVLTVRTFATPASNHEIDSAAVLQTSAAAATAEECHHERRNC